MHRWIPCVTDVTPGGVGGAQVHPTVVVGRLVVDQERSGSARLCCRCQSDDDGLEDSQRLE